MPRTALILLAVTLATATPTRAATPAPAWRAALDEVLVASGVDDPARRAAHAERFEALRAGLAPRLQRARDDERRGRVLHRYVHDRVLRRYDPSAYGLDVLLDTGRFNCVSASVFEALLASSHGLDAGVVAGPRHLFVRIDAGSRPIDVEATSARGWDVTRDVRRIAGFLLAYRLATPEDLAREGVGALYDQYRDVEPPVPVERAAAFVWHVRGEALVERGEGTRAAEAFARAARLHPGLAARSVTLRAGFARAFSDSYESGRFDEAFAIAERECAAVGPSTSSRERLQAAAVQRIVAHVEADEPAAAEAVLQAAIAAAPEVAHRLERATCPSIAAAAVRAGDFARAERLAERFRSAEPDPVEAAKLASWVAARRRNGVLPPDFGLLPGF
ncbi:MAG TPA: hypothetical protein VF139_17420, partial [Candidatus Polarisedimenticolaceae bacterium]